MTFFFYFSTTIRKDWRYHWYSLQLRGLRNQHGSIHQRDSHPLHHPSHQGQTRGLLQRDSPGDSRHERSRLQRSAERCIRHLRGNWRGFKTLVLPDRRAPPRFAHPRLDCLLQCDDRILLRSCTQAREALLGGQCRFSQRWQRKRPPERLQRWIQSFRRSRSKTRFWKTEFSRKT